MEPLRVRIRTTAGGTSVGEGPELEELGHEVPVHRPVDTRVEEVRRRGPPGPKRGAVAITWPPSLRTRVEWLVGAVKNKNNIGTRISGVAAMDLGTRLLGRGNFDGAVPERRGSTHVRLAAPTCYQGDP